MLTCHICDGPSGTSLVCEKCRPYLNQNQRHRLDVIWHKTIIEGDNCQCSYCGRSFPPESGMLCGDHIETKAARPDLRWDMNNGRCTCNDCHVQRHSGSISPHSHMANFKKKPQKPKKPPICKNYGCPFFAVKNGLCSRCAAKK